MSDQNEQADVQAAIQEDNVLDTATGVPAALPPLAYSFIDLLGKRVVIDNGSQRPFEDVVEYVGIDCIITKHGDKALFSQVKTAE